MVVSKFRIQDLVIWQKAIEIGDLLFDIADELENRKLFRFAEQLRGAAMSVSNSIAEGSGSGSKKEFAQFLNFAKRSAYENANILMILEKRGLLADSRPEVLFDNLDYLCRQITAFQKSLR